MKETPVTTPGARSRAISIAPIPLKFTDPKHFENFFLESLEIQTGDYSEFHRIYAWGIMIAPKVKFDCHKLNRAVIDKWSKTALLKIKDRAWKLLEEMKS